MNRRRMMMERRGKLVVFAEGTNAVQNTSGEGFFNDYTKISEGRINARGLLFEGYAYFGKLKIPVDFSGYKSLYIEAESENYPAVIGYGENFDISVNNSASIENCLKIGENITRKIYCFDISKINEKRFICAGITGVTSEASQALKIYNIWLE